MDKINKLTSKKIIFWIYIISLGLGATMFYFVCYFLYQNFYKTIKQSEEIIVLKRQTASDSINMDDFQKIIKTIEKKTETKIFANTNNPFK